MNYSFNVVCKSFTNKLSAKWRTFHGQRSVTLVFGVNYKQDLLKIRRINSKFSLNTFLFYIKGILFFRK